MIKTKRKILISVFLLITAICVAVSFAYAFYDFSVTTRYVGTESSDYLILNSVTYYVENPSSSISVESYHSEGYLVSNYDVICYTTNEFLEINDNACSESYDFGEQKVLIFKNLELASNATLSFSNSDLSAIDYSTIQHVVALPKTVKKTDSQDINFENVYVSDFLSLKLANNETRHNSFFIGEQKRTIAKCVYFINSFDIDQSFNLTLPCYMNLLYSTITLNQNFYVKHSYGGAYAIDTIGGEFVANESSKVIIQTPNSYYNGYFLEDLSAPIELSEYMEIEQDSTICNALLNESADYALSIVPQYIYNNTILPQEYNFYGITLEYNLDSVEWDGIISRQATTQEKTLSVVAKLGDSTITKTKSIKVIGTSDLSQATALSEEIDVLFKEKYQFANGKYEVNENLILNSLLAEFRELSGINQIEIVASDINGTHYDNTLNSEKIVVNADKVDLSELSISVGIGEEIVSESYVLKGMTRIECNQFVERLIVANPYLSYSSDSYKLLNVKNDSLYLGTSDLLKPFSLGYTSVSYRVVEAVDAASIADGTNRTDEVNIDTENYTLSMHENFSASSGRLFLVQTLNYPGGSYDIVKNIIIPSSGVGGNQYTDYVGDNAFEDYFDSLIDNRLINSVSASTAALTGETETAYTFASTYLNDDIMLFMKLDDEYINNGNAYCRVIPNDNGSYQIDINVDNIPSINTGVTVVCKFYYYVTMGDIDLDISDSQPVVIVSEQQYSFVIPGIYRCGNKQSDQFKDINLYNLLLESYPNYDNTYLYADGVSEEIELLDLTSLSNQESVNISGLEYFSNTNGIDLSGVNIVSLEPFSYVDGDNQISTLNLSDCNLTDNKVQNYLKSLTNLNVLDISNNSLSTFIYNQEPILYRRLHTLDASSQTDLRDIRGLEQVVELQTLNVANNHINEFSPLNKMTNLQSVALYGNETQISGVHSFLYGTSGKVNIPIFVDLIMSGKTIYANSLNASEALTTSSELISNGDFYVSLDVNAIVIPLEHNGQINLPSQVSNASETKIAYILTSDYEIDTPFSGLMVGSFDGISGASDIYSYSTTTQELIVILKEKKTIDLVDYTVYREFRLNYIA